MSSDRNENSDPRISGTASHPYYSHKNPLKYGNGMGPVNGQGVPRLLVKSLIKLKLKSSESMEDLPTLTLGNSILTC